MCKERGGNVVAVAGRPSTSMDCFNCEIGQKIISLVFGYIC